MPKSANQKLKLLYLADILQRESDEAHPLSVGNLISALAARGVSAERKSIYSDIEALQQAGYDIITVRSGRAGAYYLGQRNFELPEVKLLADAVQSAKFITAEKSRQLIQKLCRLASRHEGGLMQRQVHVQDRAKTINPRTYYNVDAIHSAIAENRQITFHYSEWVVSPKARRLYESRLRHGGALYQVSPLGLLWDDEYYYLVAYDAAAGMPKHYRVDRMSNLAILNEARQGTKSLSAKDLAAYSKQVFGMFGGIETDVRIRFSNHLIGVVVDRFGADIIILADGDSHFIVNVKVVISPQFFSWLFAFGPDALLLGPDTAVAQMADRLRQTAAQYPATTPNA